MNFKPIENLLFYARRAVELDGRPDWTAVSVAATTDTVFLLAEVDRVPDEDDLEALSQAVTTLTADTSDGQYVDGRFASQPVPSFEPPDLDYRNCWP